MDPQQVLHLIHPVLRRRNHILWGTFKNKLPICWSLSAFPNFKISKTPCKIMAVISTLKAFSHLKLVNNCRASDKITTYSYCHSSKTKPSNLPICVNESEAESLGQICSWWRFQSCLADLHLLKFSSLYHRWITNFSEHVWSLFITINTFPHYKVGVWTPKWISMLYCPY